MRGEVSPLSIWEWIYKARPVAYGVLRLKPWEFEELSIMDFMHMMEGHELAERVKDVKEAYYACMMTNVHIAKSSSHIKVRDVVETFHPKSKIDRLKEEELFKAEWKAAGGEI